MQSNLPLFTQLNIKKSNQRRRTKDSFRYLLYQLIILQDQRYCSDSSNNFNICKKNNPQMELLNNNKSKFSGSADCCISREDGSSVAILLLQRTTRRWWVELCSFARNFIKHFNFKIISPSSARWWNRCKKRRYDISQYSTYKNVIVKLSSCTEDAACWNITFIEVFIEQPSDIGCVYTDTGEIAGNRIDLIV